LVIAGAGLALMREELALELESTDNVVIVDKGRPSINLEFMYRASRENDPAIRAIADVLAEVWSGSAPPSPDGAASD
jgi:DNA-binding transcriptional LysR family regulator